MDQMQESMEQSENSVPERAEKALDAAYERSLAAGHPVLVISNDHLVRINPDHSRTVLRAVPKRYRIAKGTKLKIR